MTPRAPTPIDHRENCSPTGASDEFRGAFGISNMLIWSITRRGTSRPRWNLGSMFAGLPLFHRDALWLLTQQKDKQHDCNCEHG